MSAKPTPGPWIVVKNAPGSLEPAVMAGGYFVATVHGMSDGDSETLANARLIALAPDLLALVHQLAREPVGEMTKRARERMDALTRHAREMVAEIDGEETES